MNSVNLLGRLANDVELRYTASNTAVANITVAVNKRYKDSNGEWQDKASFIECSAWAGKAEAIARHFKKGERIAISGELEQETWEDKQSGGKRSKLKVRINDFDFCESNASPGQQQSRQSQPQNQPVDESDIPF